MEEERKIEQGKSEEEALRALAEFEKQKSKAATEAALMSKKLAELEIQKKRNIAEKKARIEAEEKKKAIEVFESSNVCYRRYSIDDIETATDHFNESYKIGEGGYGPVYQAELDHTSVAVKILRPDRSHGQRQFQQEVIIFSLFILAGNNCMKLSSIPKFSVIVDHLVDNNFTVFNCNNMKLNKKHIFNE